MKKLVSLLLAVVMVMSIFAIVPVSVSAADANTVYLINSANWSNVHAYAWNNTSFSENSKWPGQSMTSAGTHSSGAQMYSITFSSPYEKIIFNGGEGGPQTDDLDYQGGMGYDNSTGSWVAVDPNPNPDPTSNPNPNPGDTMTVYFQNNWMWTDVKVYFWGSSSSNSAEWPGDAVQVYGNDGTYDVYSATVPTDVVGVIFNGFDGGNGALNQTPDILDAADGKCYTMKWNEAESKNDVIVNDINDIIIDNPTDAPTAEPTDKPTETPTAEPTIEPTEEPTVEPTVEPTDAPVEGLFVRIDGKTYAVEKGETYTYKYCLTVPDVKISGIDMQTFYDTDGLDFVPYTDEYGDTDLTKHFPNLAGVVNNFDIDGEIYYNYSSVGGVRFADNAVVFEGQFKVTADKGIFDIESKIVTMADTDMNKLVYDYEKLGDFTAVNNFSASVVEPTDKPTVEPTVEPSEQPTAEPTAEPTVKPTVKPADGLFVKVDGVLYEVNKGDVITYNYCLSVDAATKIASLDMQTFYDTDGLDFEKYTDEYGDDNLAKHFPNLAGVIYNFDIDGEIYYNYSSVGGVRLNNNAVVFEGQFKVTADKGTYEINTKIVTLADTNMNKLVYDYEKVGDFDSSSVLTDADIYEPDDPTVAPTTPTTKPTAEPTVKPTVDEEGLYVRINGDLYEVTKGETVRYNYCMTLDSSIKISSLDMHTFYDTDGLDVAPYTDEYGDTDLTKHFPKLVGLVSNFDIDGEIYYNYSNIAGARFTNDAIVFDCEFTVTADKGIYDIDTKIVTMADTNMNRIVYNYEKLGEFSYKEFLVGKTIYEPSEEPTDKPTVKPSVDPTVEPSVEPTEAPTDPEGLFIRVGRTLYEVEQGKTYTLTYFLQVEDKLVGSLDSRIAYDTKGLEFVPTTDKDGYEDTLAMFPIIMAPVYNVKNGVIYFNYSSSTGVKFHTQESVLFQGKFKVTASEGVYEIAPEIYCLADENLGIIVDDGLVCGDYWEKAVLDAKVYVPEDNTLTIGDVNFDGKINVFDVTAIQRYAAQHIDFTEDQKIVADTNFDGKINIFDATLVQKYIAGYISKFE